MKVKSESEVTQSCWTVRDPMDCSPPGSSIHGIFQARVLEWGAIAFSESRGLKSTNGWGCCDPKSAVSEGSEHRKLIFWGDSHFQGTWAGG